MPVKCAVCGKMHETLEEMKAKERAMIGSVTPNLEPIPRKIKLKKKISEDAF